MIVAAALAAGLIVQAAMPAMAFYQTPSNKKGLLISQQSNQCLSDLSELGLGQVVANIGTDVNINACDPLASYCRRNGITMTMIIINRYHNSNIIPAVDQVGGTGTSFGGTYGFNVLTSEGEAAVRSYARSIAAHYSDSVSNWVIGNEVNDACQWDYNGIMDIDAHADSYAKAFRVFYEEIKNVNPDAHVLIPFDMRWNATTGEQGNYPVSQYLPKLNERLKDLDYGIAWHAYPVHFLTKPEFLDDDGITFDLSTPNINLKNINVLTDYMQNADMLSPNGTVRHLLLTEQGFTSACEDGENRHAEAISQAYAIARDNPYIEGFYLNRQVDAGSQVAVGGAFGLWTRNESAAYDETPLTKKKAWYTYQSLQ
ncbi:MAG: DUF5722 domain-containing protein [Eubacteriales bacterium]|nr:DUF5722 domain-containing protein [Eubacteriales bacterium]